MTKEEARTEIEEEFKIFLEGAALDDVDILEEKMKENAELRKVVEANRMAIKALEQEPYDFAKWVAREIFDDEWEYNKDAFAEIACRKLEKLGIVEANGDEWELVELEPCEDAISRQAVIDAIDKWVKTEHILVTLPTDKVTPLFKSVNKLSPVNPQSKTGHWIRWYEKVEYKDWTDYMPYCKCSECGKQYDPHSSQFIQYCSKCGARMIDPHESEEG